MSLLLPFNDQHLPSFGKNWSKFIIWGCFLTIIGLLAISATTLTTLITVSILGFMIFISGVIITIDTFSFWWGKWNGFFLHLIISVLYLIVGVMLIQSPLQGSVSLTLLLGLFYIFAGIVRVVSATSLKTPHWGWSGFNGLITLLLGILIIFSWPASSLYIIGLFIGVDLLFTGWAFIMAGIAAKRFSNQMK